jgi:hypothetical protein
MVNVRIVHDVSHDTALKVLRCLRSSTECEDLPLPYGAIYQLIKDAISDYAFRYDHLLKQLHPGGCQGICHSSSSLEITTDSSHESEKPSERSDKPGSVDG